MAANNLTIPEFDRWLDWLLYYKGLPVCHANDMALSTDDDPEGIALFAEYVAWRK